MQLYWNYTSAWVISSKFAAFLQNTFSEEHLWRVASGHYNKKHTISCLLSLSSVIVYQFHSYTKILTLIPFIPNHRSPHSYLDSPHSHPNSHHCHPDSSHSHPDSHPNSPHSHPDSPHLHPYSPHSHPCFRHYHPDFTYSHPYSPDSHRDSLHFHPDSPHSHHFLHFVSRFSIPVLQIAMQDCIS